MSYAEDAYTYETDSSGQVWVDYKADELIWTERFQWLPATVVWHVRAVFPQDPKASTHGGDKSSQRRRSIPP